MVHGIAQGTAGPSSSRASCATARRSGACSRCAPSRRPTSRNCRHCRSSCAATVSDPLSRRRGVAGQAGRLVPRAARLPRQRLHAGRRGAGGVPRPAGRVRPRRHRLQHAGHVGDGRCLDVMNLRPSMLVVLASGYLRPAEDRARARARHPRHHPQALHDRRARRGRAAPAARPPRPEVWRPALAAPRPEPVTAARPQ